MVKPRFDGDTPSDVRLWHTYVFLARRHASQTGGRLASNQPAIVDDPENRVEDSLAEALQAVLFSAFALEYRLKRVFIALGVHLKRGETLSPLFDRFWNELRNVDRCDGKGKCTPPPSWAVCETKLKQLILLRNRMAHAKYEEVVGFLGSSDSLAHTREYYNAVADALMLINVGTGYDTRPLAEIEAYFQPLKVIGK